MKNVYAVRLMGDVMIGRLVNNQINKMGYSYPWGNILPYLHREGVNIINLETTLTTSDKKVMKVFNFKADPDKVQTLRAANIHAANIANNHIFDYAVEGMIETIRVLDENKILHTGAGKNLTEARKPAILKYKDLVIGILGCTDNEPSWHANDHPGTFYVKVGDTGSLRNEIIALRAKVDLLILSIHWGPNMVEEPEDAQVQFAHQLVDLGADIIHGHSAHIFQGIEVYENKLILYDTGDFIDDYMVDQELRNDCSFLYEVEITDKAITGLKLIPVLISQMQVNAAEGNDRRTAIARMQYLSSKFGTQINDKGEVIF